MAIIMLARASSMKSAVKKPTTPAAGIIYPIPDFISLAIMNTPKIPRFTPKIAVCYQ